MRNKSLGNWGENLALTYLQKKGYRFVSRNFRCQLGEIDLVVTKDDTLVFVEIKTRQTDEYGQPELAVNSRKVRSMIKTAQYFRLLHPHLPESYRLDVIAIRVISELPTKATLRHFKNITN
jgi:putative endonuclease